MVLCTPAFTVQTSPATEMILIYLIHEEREPTFRVRRSIHPVKSVQSNQDEIYAK